MRFLIVFVSVFLICVDVFSDCEDGYAKHGSYGCHSHNDEFTNTTPAPYPDGEGVVHHVHPDSNNPHAKPPSDPIEKNIEKGEVNQPTPTPTPKSAPIALPSTPAEPPFEPSEPSEPTGDIDVSHDVETNIIFPLSVRTEPVEPMLEPLWVTEYMMRDGGFERLPTWIELYNPNRVEVSLEGYIFTWKGGIDIIQDFSIPPLTAVILATKETRKKAGIMDNQIYDLGIDCGRCLKLGWGLQGELIDFLEKHPAKGGWWKERESFQRYRHVNPEGYYYGRANDVGSPGFYEISVPAAPILIRRHVGMWATLKRNNHE